MSLVSNCHSYPIHSDGGCRWCGRHEGSHEFVTDVLLKEIESVLCDWNSPHQMDSLDLVTNIYKVAILIKKYQCLS